MIDASVGLKWVLDEPDSHLAHALAAGRETLLIPDFWLAEATNVLWLQVRRKILTAAEAREGLALLRDLVQPTATGDMGLHEVALDIGIEVNHSTYDTLYLAFTIAMGARGLVVADGAFVRDMANHPDAELRALMLPLGPWVTTNPSRNPLS